jgi:hypothetical protein
MTDPIVKGLVYMICLLGAVDYYLWVNHSFTVPL